MVLDSAVLAILAPVPVASEPTPRVVGVDGGEAPAAPSAHELPTGPKPESAQSSAASSGGATLTPDETRKGLIWVGLIVVAVFLMMRGCGGTSIDVQVSQSAGQLISVDKCDQKGKLAFCTITNLTDQQFELMNTGLQYQTENASGDPIEQRPLHGLLGAYGKRRHQFVIGDFAADGPEGRVILKIY